MTITTLVTHIEPGTAEAIDAGLATPLALAEAWSARLTVLVFTAEAQGSGTLDEDATADRVRAAAERRGVNCEVRTRSSFAYGVGDVLADHLRVSDLGVFVVPPGHRMGQRLMLGAAIFDSGRPVLIVPQARPLIAAPARIIVAWDATTASVRAVQAALPFMRRAAETLIVTVSDDKEVRHGQSGIELTHLLARHGAQARFSALRRGSGVVLEAIMDAAEGAASDLLVMGAVRHSPLRNIVLGSATQDLLDRGPRLPTLITA